MCMCAMDERCQDLSLAVAELRHHAALNEENSLYPDN